MQIKIKSTFEVTTTRTLKEGLTCRISPSYGCIDIPAGVIEIVKIGDQEYMEDASYDYSSWENNLQGLWVQYKYTGSNECDILPIEEFVNHTTIA